MKDDYKPYLATVKSLMGVDGGDGVGRKEQAWMRDGKEACRRNTRLLQELMAGEWEFDGKKLCAMLSVGGGEAEIREEFMARAKRTIQNLSEQIMGMSAKSRKGAGDVRVRSSKSKPSAA